MYTAFLNKALILGIALCAISFTSFGQSNDAQYSIDELITKKFSSVDSLNKFFRPYQRDTVSIKTFIAKAGANDYLIGESYGNNTLGVFFRDRSKYNKAILYHKRSLSLANALDNDELRVSALNMLGVVYRRMDAVRSALDNHQLALSIAEKSNDKTYAILKNTTISHNSIGNIYLTLKQYDRAEEQFKKALVYEEQLESKLGLAINYHNIGYAYEARGVFDEALTNYFKSLHYNREINSNLGIMICDNSIAQIYLKQGNPEKALELITPTLSVAEEMEDNFYIAMANVNKGWALTELKRYKEAETYLSKGLQVSKDNNLQSFIATSYQQLSHLYEVQGNYKSALDYNKQFQEQEEKFLNESNQQYISDLLIKYEAEKQQSQIDLLEKENQIMNMRLGQNNKIFLFTLALLLMALALVFILYRQFKLRNERRLLRMEQKLLRSQMNPHFIFNSLLSIKLYMLNNDKDSAIAYLDQFSKLVRTILSTSLEKEISLAEELDTMKLYVNIENIRLCNEIDYKVHVANDLDLENIKIPSLTLQPFIENALWHGLSPKDGYKSLELDVSRKNDSYVQISITDNGIGRERTMEIVSEKRNTQKKSIGINLTKERLTNFSKNFTNTHALSIIDLYDDGKIPSGTQVQLNLPVK